MEPVTGDIKREAINVLTARLATDPRVRLEDRILRTQMNRGRQTSEPGADDGCVYLLKLAIHTLGPRRLNTEGRAVYSACAPLIKVAFTQIY